jgi:hypothetical protein
LHYTIEFDNVPSMLTTPVEIFRDSETHHRLSLFDQPALKAIEALLFEKNGKPYIKCLATDKDRPAKKTSGKYLKTHGV